MKKPKCYFDGKGIEGMDGRIRCSQQVSAKDDFCSGCKQYICENHSINAGVMGFGHDPGNHAKWEDDAE